LQSAPASGSGSMSTISPPVGYDIDEPAIIVADLDELAVIDRWFSIILQLMRHFKLIYSSI
jgi:hypothetical protein